MNGLPPAARIRKMVVAPGYHGGDGRTLYLICQMEEEEHYYIFELLPDGYCVGWTEPPCPCVKQAEGIIWQRTLKEP